ncbi:hypothetical protein [Undibacterium terreum]|uniref:Uncharacterized protein n=1 Tax=Undibacterium terreum TaxID=1224302 RepID=A0A916XKI7_9BURK|nr:hypothetical protein [Undibacterium terreum]GGC81580.1 hypothetical protein GCM10011396_31010 [Undibacterium terreum]
MQIIFRCDPALIPLLPQPIPAKQALPDWLRAMPAKAFSDMHEREIRTVKQCPPFVDAMSHGFMILLPCDIRVEHGTFTWDWDLPPLSVEEHPRSPLSFHAPAQIMGAPFHDGRSSAIKFNSFWTIELEPGWSLFATHPVNRDDLPFRLLSGLVDSDRFTDAGINFPAIWTKPDFNGILPKGTPVAQCFPVPRAAQTLVFEVMSPEKSSRYTSIVSEVLTTPGIYRKRFRAKRGGPGTQ